MYTTVIGENGDSEDDCSKGTLIEDGVCEDEDGDCFTISYAAVDNIPGADFPLPRKTNGIVGATTVIFSNFMSNAIYVANEDTNDGIDGTVEFCVQTSIKETDSETGEFTASHIDSKKMILVNLAGNFASFEQVVAIEDTVNNDFETTAVKIIDVETFLCNIRNERVRVGRSYMIGQQFRICVGPQSAALEEGYAIDTFVDVTCGRGTAARSLLVDSIPLSPITSIDPLPLLLDRRAFESVITTGYGVAGNTDVTCTGRVSLSYTAPGRALRDLQTSTEVAVPSGAGAGGGAEELLEGLFELNIEMDIPSNESSAPLPSSMTTTVAVIAFGSIYVVSSMIW